jgi:streptogramin lyase
MNHHVRHASLASWVLLATAGCRFDPHGGADPATTGSSGGYGGASTAGGGNEMSAGGTAGAPNGTGGSGGDTPTSPDAGQDATMPPAPDGGTQVADSSTPGADGATGLAHVRLGNFGSAHDSFDFCLRLHDPANASPYDIGPVLGSHGVSTGIPRQAASAYFDFAPGQYDVRLVDAGAQDCTKATYFSSDAPFFIPYDIARAPEMAKGTWWTLVAHGFGNHGNDSYTIFQDEHASVPEKALVRFANLTSVPIAMDFGFGSDASFSPVFTQVATQQVGSGDGVDTLGYLPVAPASQVYAVYRHAGGGADVAKLLVDLPAGDVASFFAFNIDYMAVCHDVTPPKGLLSDCQGKTVVPPDAGSGTPPSDAGPPDVPDHGAIREFSLGIGAHPTDMVLGPDGHFWIVESGLTTIARLDTQGGLDRFDARLPSDDHAVAFDPRGISVGPDGALWFGEIDRIMRMTQDGMLTAFPLPHGGGAAPRATTAGPDGNVWFVEPVANAIGRISPSGELTEFSIVTADDEAGTPQGITKGADGNLWFSETSYRIGRITPGGQITKYAMAATAAWATRLTAATDGNVWFTEENGAAIGRITPSGDIAEFSVKAGDPNAPIGVYAIAPRDGELWFTEQNGQRIGKMTTAGVLDRVYPTPPNGMPKGIAVGPDGQIWYADYGRDVIARLTP